MTQEAAVQASVEAAAPKPRRNVRKWFVALGFAVVALYAWLFVARRPVTYVSPPFGDDSVHFRMQLPIGWDVSHFKAIPGPGWGRAELLIGESGADWRPQWLQKWIPKERRPLPFMLVQIYYLEPGARPRDLPPPKSDGSLSWKEGSPESPAEKWMGANGAVLHQVYLMGRNYYAPNGDYQISIQYHREDRGQLRPTLDAMGKTIRITR